MIRLFSFAKSIFAVVITLGLIAACGAQQKPNLENGVSENKINKSEALSQQSQTNEPIINEPDEVKPPINTQPKKKRFATAPSFDLNDYKILEDELISFNDHAQSDGQIRTFPLRIKKTLAQSKLTNDVVVKFSWNLTDLDTKMSVTRENTEGIIGTDYQKWIPLNTGSFIDETAEDGTNYTYQFIIKSKERGVNQFHVTHVTLPKGKDVK
jgi:hypothetical protein